MKCDRRSSVLTILWLLSWGMGVFLPTAMRGQAAELPLQDNRSLSLEDLDTLDDADRQVQTSGVELSLDALDSLGDGPEEDGGQEQRQPCWKENLRFTVDLAERPIYSEHSGLFSNAFFLGIDLHKVFSNSEGDWGTLTLQPFLTRLDGVRRRPPFFDDAHDWELVYRICNFNYTKYGEGRRNIRIGHMEVPYGLEQVINTNGTLRDYIHGRNIGVKGDWGVSLNGETDEGEYEVALLRGSGNEWRRREDPYLVAGRIGTPRGEPISIGMSALYGDVYRYTGPTPTVRRSRIGVDFITGKGPFTVMGDVSIGRDPGTSVVNTVFEIDWHNRHETWLVYNQMLFFNLDLPTGWDTNAINVLGVRWTPDNHWALSGQWSQDITSFAGNSSTGVFALQVRYRF